jgi:hypothetical protein
MLEGMGDLKHRLTVRLGDGRPSFSLPLLLWLPNCGVLTENPESLDACLERLQEMENDGLVRSDDGGITVTEEGKPFVRNICMGFDVRLWQDKPTTQLFSMTI